MVQYWSREERALYDARAEVGAWEHARKILGPLVAATRPIGSAELTWAMEGALARANENLARARRELARLEEGGEE